MRFAALFLAVLLGCASNEPVLWSKPGVDANTLARDQEECEAYARAGRLKGQQARPLGLGMEGFPSPAQTPASTMERFQAEQELRAECMKQRGYSREKAG
jgi:hypothetical protein